MAWIEAHQDLSQHPKTKRLARMPNISVRESVGSLFMFWWWATEYAECGMLIHDWENFGGRYFEKREKNRQRQHKFRDKKSVTRESMGYIHIKKRR